MSTHRHASERKRSFPHDRVEVVTVLLIAGALNVLAWGGVAVLALLVAERLR